MRPLTVASCLTVVLCFHVANLRADETDDDSRFPVLNNAEALQRIGHQSPVLPEWARVLAVSLPNTTVEMLRLDYLHRAKNPLDKTLRAKMRWTAADAIGCEYGRQTAVGDLRRAGMRLRKVRNFTERGETTSADEAAAVSFARKLTTSGHSVTDAEVADLIARFDASTVMAMAHTVAHANFQDRIFLALGVQIGEGGPLPPFDMTEHKNGRIAAPKRKPWKTVQDLKMESSGQRPEWRKQSADQLKEALQSQQKRKLRIPLPTGSDKSKRLSPVLWNHVSLALQPELTQAWFRCMGTFYSEAQPDMVFASSVFWVVTRSKECFY